MYETHGLDAKREVSLTVEWQWGCFLSKTYARIYCTYPLKSVFFDTKHVESESNENSMTIHSLSSRQQHFDSKDVGIIVCFYYTSDEITLFNGFLKQNYYDMHVFYLHISISVHNFPTRCNNFPLQSRQDIALSEKLLSLGAKRPQKFWYLKQNTSYFLKLKLCTIITFIKMIIFYMQYRIWLITYFCSICGWYDFKVKEQLHKCLQNHMY